MAERARRLEQTIIFNDQSEPWSKMMSVVSEKRPFPPQILYVVGIG